MGFHAGCRSLSASLRLNARTGPVRRTLAICVVGGAALVVPAVAWAIGELTQKGGTAGCVSETGTGGACEDGKALNIPFGLSVSSDGKSVYVASTGGTVAILDRSTSGELTQKAGTAGCVSENGTGGVCQDGHAIGAPQDVAVSPDGKSVYVAASAVSSGSVTIFDRNTASGELTQKAGTAGCVSEDGTGGTCQDGKALVSARGIVVSPDGKSVYVASSSSNAVAAFDRDTTTGELTQKAATAGCVSEDGTGGACQDGKALDGPQDIAVSPDGKSVYVPTATSDAVAMLDRNTTTGELTQKAGTAGCVSEDGTGGACQDGNALDGADAVAVSSDNRSVYATAYDSNAVAVLDRNTTTGELTQKTGTAGCVSATGTNSGCQDGRAVSGPYNFGVAVSPDDSSVYVGSYNLGAVAIFDRDTSGTGELTQKAGTAGCVSEDGTDGAGGACQDGRALGSAIGVVTSPDGRSVYVASSDGAVAIFDRAVPPSQSPSPAAFGVKTLVTLKLAAKRIPAKGPLKVRVTNANDFLVTGRLWGQRVIRVSVSRKRLIKLKAKSFRVVAHDRKTVKLRLPKVLRRLFKRTGKLTLRLTAKVKDPAGNTRTVKKRVTVKLKKKKRRR
jgi:DNA-binding beta-propeller fold protein YncE